jgi:hypothetical protein
VLQLLGIRAGEKSVIQGFVGDFSFLHLPFGPFVPVEAQFHAPRRIAANFDEDRSEVGVVDVEIVVVDVDGLVAVELKLPVYFLAVERLRLLLATPMNTMPSLTCRCRRNSLAMSSFRSL